MLSGILDFLFGWILIFPPLIGIIIISLILSLLMVLVYKFFTDQKLMKQLKLEMKELQKKMKELRSEPEKALVVQKEAMEKNMKYMMQSFKVSFITLIPVLIIFGWLQGNLSFLPITPGEQFSVSTIMKNGIGGNVTAVVPEGVTLVGSNMTSVENGIAAFNFTGQKGTYAIKFQHNKLEYQKSVTITEGKEYADQDQTYKGDIQKIHINYQKRIVMNLFGWQIGWLGAYIIFSIVFSLGLRKLFDVH